MRGYKITVITNAGFHEQGFCDNAVAVLNDYGDVVTRVFPHSRIYQRDFSESYAIVLCGPQDWLRKVVLPAIAKFTQGFKGHYFVLWDGSFPQRLNLVAGFTSVTYLEVPVDPDELRLAFAEETGFAE